MTRRSCWAWFAVLGGGAVAPFSAVRGACVWCVWWGLEGPAEVDVDEGAYGFDVV